MNFLNNKRGHHTFAGQGIALELIRRYGIRVAELGDYYMEYDLKNDEQKEEVYNVLDLLLIEVCIVMNI